MKESVNVKWIDGMSFEAEVMDYKITIDADPEFGGRKKGPKPKLLLLVSLAGCTGMDVVSLLNKMRVEFSALNIRVDGNMVDEHPKKFTNITITYELTGKNIDRSKVEKAVVMSQEKYCGVSATLKDSVKIDYIINIKS
jgi:putative redox protein